MEFLRALLSPLIFLMSKILDAFYSVTNSYGASIILLSLFMTIVSYPVARYGFKIERRYKEKVNAMAPALASIKEKYKGEKRFKRIEKLYEANNYHPIQSIFSASGFMVQLPFLLAALLMFLNYPPLAEKSFLFVRDLSAPDALVSAGGVSINVLPFFMAGIAIFDSFQKQDMLQADRLKFVFISLVLCALVYPLPAAVIFYWICNNLWALMLTFWQNHRQTKSRA